MMQGVISDILESRLKMTTPYKMRPSPWTTIERDLVQQ